MIWLGLGIYLSSVVFSMSSVKLVVKANQKKLKREGYKYKKKKTISFEERIVERIKNMPAKIVAYAFPVFNIIFGIYFIFNNSNIYDNYLQNCLNDGSIYKVETTKPVIKEQIKNLIKEYDITDEEVLEIAKIEPKESQIPNYLPTKPFTEMSREEIIAALQKIKEELEQQGIKEKEEKGQTLKLGM